MDPNIFLSILCVTLLSGLISLGFQLYVSRQLKKIGEKLGIPLGKRSWIRPFVLGWQYAKQLEIVDVMVFWSFLLGLTFIGVFATAFAVIAAAP